MNLNGKGKHNSSRIVVHAVWCGGHAAGRGCHCDRPERGLCDSLEVQQVHI